MGSQVTQGLWQPQNLKGVGKLSFCSAANHVPAHGGPAQLCCGCGLAEGSLQVGAPQGSVCDLT